MNISFIERWKLKMILGTIQRLFKSEKETNAIRRGNDEALAKKLYGMPFNINHYTGKLITEKHYHSFFYKKIETPIRSQIARLKFKLMVFKSSFKREK